VADVIVNTTAFSSCWRAMEKRTRKRTPEERAEQLERARELRELARRAQAEIDVRRREREAGGDR
jgi:hypothetical protein